MKKTILTIILAITGIMVFGQARLGVSVADIKSEFSDKTYNLKTDYDKEGNYYILITTNKSLVVYYFNSKQLCEVTFIIPDDTGSLNFYAELYNNQYAIISDTKWVAYSNEGKANIELVYPEETRPFFVWK